MSRIYSCHDYPVEGVELLQTLENETLIALHYNYNERPSIGQLALKLTPLTFVNDEHLPPWRALENWAELPLIRDSLVRCDQNVILGTSCTQGRSTVKEFKFLDNFACLRITVERYDPQLRRPALKLTDPVCDRRVGDDN